MKTTFEYFFYGVPIANQPLYALYNVLDNRFIIQSHDFDILHDLRLLLKSKTNTDIIEITVNDRKVNVDITDNSVIENWGLRNKTGQLFNEVNQAVGNGKDRYRSYMVVNPVLKCFEPVTDLYKQDLQQQFFLFYHCLDRLTRCEGQTDQIQLHIKQAAELGESYQHCLSLLLDCTGIDSEQGRVQAIDFLRHAGLFYE